MGGLRIAPLLVAGLWSAFASQAFGAPGDLDPSFSRDGKLRIDFGTDPSVVEPTVLGIEQLADGKIVVVAASGTNPSENSTANILIARLGTDGSLDTSFSGDGSQVVDPPGEQSWSAASIEPDGSLAVVGEQQPSPRDFVVARIRSDGVLDPSFSGDGVRQIDFDSDSDDGAAAVVTQPDGRLVVGGFAYPGEDFAFVRLGRDGELDPSFSADGRATITFAEESRLNDLALSDSGEVVAVGEVGAYSSFRDLAVARLSPDGAPDPSFDGDGTATFDVGLGGEGGGASGHSVVVQDDGRIVIGGVSAFGTTIGPSAGSLSPVLVRLLRDGGIDQSLPVLTSLPVPDVADIAVQPDGILGAGYSVVGHSRFSNFSDFVLFRRHADGAADGSFPRSDGSVRTDFKGAGDLATELTEQADGKVLVAGTAETRRGGTVGVARYVMRAGRRDQDADGLGDRRDRCPRGFAKRRRGCPRLKSEGALALTVHDSFVGGQLSSNYLECVDHVRVLMLKRRPGKDRVVRSSQMRYDPENEIGSFNVTLNTGRGRYYARAPRHREEIGICGAVTSSVVRIRK
jgi:uncharacterized delta-60 repeat protein